MDAIIDFPKRKIDYEIVEKMICRFASKRLQVTMGTGKELSKNKLNYFPAIIVAHLSDGYDSVILLEH